MIRNPFAGSGRDRRLPKQLDPIAHVDLTLREDLGTQAPSMDEAREHAAPSQTF